MACCKDLQTGVMELKGWVVMTTYKSRAIRTYKAFWTLFFVWSNGL